MSAILSRPQYDNAQCEVTQALASTKKQTVFELPMKSSLVLAIVYSLFRAKPLPDTMLTYCRLRISSSDI